MSNDGPERHLTDAELEARADYHAAELDRLMDELARRDALRQVPSQPTAKARHLHLVDGTKVALAGVALWGASQLREHPVRSAAAIAGTLALALALTILPFILTPDRAPNIAGRLPGATSSPTPGPTVTPTTTPTATPTPSDLESPASSPTEVGDDEILADGVDPDIPGEGEPDEPDSTEPPSEPEPEQTQPQPTEPQPTEPSRPPPSPSPTPSPTPSPAPPPERVCFELPDFGQVCPPGQQLDVAACLELETLAEIEACLRVVLAGSETFKPVGAHVSDVHLEQFLVAAVRVGGLAESQRRIVLIAQSLG